VDCDIIAISTLPRSTRDRQRKCDKLDAKAILREITNPMSDYSVVWVPDEEVEAARDLARMHDDAARALKRAKQQLLAFLLRHGIVWNEKTPNGTRRKTWGQHFMRWLGKVSFGQPSLQGAFEVYRRQVDQAAALEYECRALIAAEAGKERWKPYVDALKRLKGVDTITAFLAAAEFGDFGRFSNGGQVSCWLGTVPRNDSSGEKERRGRITKAGNGHLRRALSEGNACISRRNFKPKKLEEGQTVSAAVESIAQKANDRLLKRYRHLADDCGKPECKARTAVVNEQIRWIWVIGLAVKEELAA
jgi:transposase